MDVLQLLFWLFTDYQLAALAHDNLRKASRSCVRVQCMCKVSNLLSILLKLAGFCHKEVA